MTAFARHEMVLDSGVLSWEIRSVNHRYLELSLRMDESFRPLEIAVRKVMSAEISRGKVEAILRFQPAHQGEQALEIDEKLASAVVNASRQLAAMTAASTPIDPLKLLQWPGILKQPDVDMAILHEQALQCLKQTLTDFIDTRRREGASLAVLLQQRCQDIGNIARDVRQLLPEILTRHHEKLLQRLQDLQVELDSERLAQEVALLAQKSDVAEELDRLESHISEVQNILSRQGPVGRRLDFLMQELNREANTLGSKSIDTATTRYAVDLKVLIEQMREQIQNIE
ncbi:Protein YicC [Methylophaga frappieri]|uniref:Protein YicC n=2 Tax=Methylophaga frappieri (strain ATCC BAA-2434 / DSM 25690 / JAM7) TaxID=754477 RepID=I1YHU1_METFJ|nr:Protein YicC [Methylophaga frappieri]